VSWGNYTPCTQVGYLSDIKEFVKLFCQISVNRQPGGVFLRKGPKNFDKLRVEESAPRMFHDVMPKKKLKSNRTTHSIPLVRLGSTDCGKISGDAITKYFFRQGVRLFRGNI